MKHLVTTLPLICLVGLLITSRDAGAQNIVTNGGFESGAFNQGWTNVDASGFSGVSNDPTFANSGNDYAFLGASPNPGSLSQTLTTIPGQLYTLSFSLASDSGVPPNFFQVLFDGNVVLTLTNTTSFPYTLYNFPSLLATGAATPLEFRYENDADFFRLDDVSVTSAVPEPSSFLLAGPAIAILGLLLWRRARGERARA